MTDRPYKCQRCGGNPRGVAFVNTGPDISGHYMTDTVCDYCDGTGRWTSERHQAWTAGQAWERQCRARGETIYETAERLGISASDVCKIGDGRLPVPEE